MDKPTIFFSHSSKDRDFILPIKDKIVDITGSTIDVFMSSDGQSIPLGRNWVSKIEEGLEIAQIMFVFVTPNSIRSDWIYFEAGYAYSKGIEVIPVGIGVHIGELKAPLNLLQGFDILSCDSLDNFISVINKKFDVSFKGKFADSDYIKVSKIIFNEEIDFIFFEIFNLGIYEYSQYYGFDEKSSITKDDDGQIYKNIKNYLDENKIQYSSSDQTLLVSGIRIVWDIIGIKHNIKFYLSTYNFKESFELFIKLLDVMGINSITVKLAINDKYDCLYRAEHLSSFISSVDVLGYAKNTTEVFKYKDTIEWWIEDRVIRSKLHKRILHFTLKLDEADVNDVIGLMNCLYKIGIVYKK